MAYEQEATKVIILDRLAEGVSLRKICESDDVPNRATVMRWLDDDAEFATKYARAKDIGLDDRADKLEADIAAEEDVARAKLKFEYAKWYLSKLMPKKYGDKSLVGSDPENPLPAGFTVNLVKPVGDR